MAISGFVWERGKGYLITVSFFYWNQVKSVILVLISVIYIVIDWINMCIFVPD